MTTYRLHLKLDDEESIFLGKLLKEYLETADPGDDNPQTEYNIRSAKSILAKRYDNVGYCQVNVNHAFYEAKFLFSTMKNQ